MNALDRCLGLFFLIATLTFSMGITRLIAADAENSAPGKNVPASNDAAIEAKIDSLLRTMTLDEKIGQMTEIDLGAIKDRSDIQKYCIGSVLSGGDSDPPDNSPQTWAKTYDELQSWALKTRLKIPLIYGIDAVHGHNNVLGAVIFPHNIGLGATRNPELVEKAARITAIEVSGTGINWTFAPCIAVARNIRWGRTYESFGETPELAES
ncbi:MAG: glycoside hydrolase family 3 N-terminal domain-containing protein, partial [Thermoguttaceae bacterium]